MESSIIACDRVTADVSSSQGCPRSSDKQGVTISSTDPTSVYMIRAGLLGLLLTPFLTLGTIKLLQGCTAGLSALVNCLDGTARRSADPAPLARSLHPLSLTGRRTISRM
jgi:hypothetical protein